LAHLLWFVCLGATPKGILKEMKAMGVSELNIYHVKSHLQVPIAFSYFQFCGGDFSPLKNVRNVKGIVCA